MSNNEISEQAAVTAAESWLVLIDKGDAEESLKRASTTFRAVVTAEQWKTSLDAVQTPLGKAVSRKLKSKRFTEELPGVPDGEYVVIEYETAFERKKNSTETMTLMKDADGEWHVAGIFVK